MQTRSTTSSSRTLHQIGRVGLATKEGNSVATLCVYCSSGRGVDVRFFNAARAFGTAIAAAKHRLVFGGIDIGLMGALAHAARHGGAHITGVVPEVARDSPLVFAADDVIFTVDIRARKQAMERLADAFIVLPGGFGTLDEFFEILTLKQMQMHRKPIVLLDQDGFFQPLLELINHLFTHAFASAGHHGQLFHVAANAEDALEHLVRYQPPEFALQWS